MEAVTDRLIQGFLYRRKVTASKVVKPGERDFVESLGCRWRDLMRLFPGGIEDVAPEHLEFLAADKPRMGVQHVLQERRARAREAGQLRDAGWLPEVFLRPPSAEMIGGDGFSK